MRVGVHASTRRLACHMHYIPVRLTDAHTATSRELRMEIAELLVRRPTLWRFLFRHSVPSVSTSTAAALETICYRPTVIIPEVSVFS